jgi:hypothetical protein
LYIEPVQKFRLLLLTGLLAVVAAANDLYAQPLGFSLMHGRKRVDIPIEIYNNLVVVPLLLNETLPLKFILDTGVRTAILTQKSFSDILNLAYTRKYTITGPGGEKMVDAYVTNNVSLNLPGVNGKGHALLVLDKDYLELRNYLGTEVHGILGYELFSRFIVRVDYERKMLTLFVPNAYRTKRKFDEIPITIEDTKPYAVLPVTLSDGTIVEAKLLVDSGASHPLLLDPLSDRRITVPSKVVSSTIGRGLGGEILGKTGRIKSIKLGTSVLNNVYANFPDENSYSDTTTMKVFRNGTLGGAVLSRFIVVFDFPNEKIYVKRNGNFKEPFHYNVSGLTIRSTGKGLRLDEFEIVEVRKGSAGARAGLEEGDKITSINGISSDVLSLGHIMARLSQKPGKRVRMEIDRNGKRLRTDIILSDQI